MQGQVVRAKLCTDLGGDIGRGTAIAQEGAALAEHRPASELTVARALQGVEIFATQPAERQPGRQELEIRLRGPAERARWAEQVAEVLAYDLSRVTAGQLRKAPGNVGEAEPIVGLPQPVRGCFGDVAKARLADLQGLERGHVLALQPPQRVDHAPERVGQDADLVTFAGLLDCCELARSHARRGVGQPSQATRDGARQNQAGATRKDQRQHSRHGDPGQPVRDQPADLVAALLQLDLLRVHLPPKKLEHSYLGLLEVLLGPQQLRGRLPLVQESPQPAAHRQKLFAPRENGIPDAAHAGRRAIDQSVVCKERGLEVLPGGADLVQLQPSILLHLDLHLAMLGGRLLPLSVVGGGGHPG